MLGWSTDRSRGRKPTLPVYKDKPELSRDEAILKCFLLSNVVNASWTRKWALVLPTIGFDPEKVAEVLKVPDNWVVTVLISMDPG